MTAGSAIRKPSASRKATVAAGASAALGGADRTPTGGGPLAMSGSALTRNWLPRAQLDSLASRRGRDKRCFVLHKSAIDTIHFAVLFKMRSFCHKYHTCVPQTPYTLPQISIMLP